MKKVAVLIVAGVALAGCSQYGAGTQQERIHHAAVVGGVVGAGIGAIATGSVHGAVVGAGIGAVAGAAIVAHHHADGYGHHHHTY